MCYTIVHMIHFICTKCGKNCSRPNWRYKQGQSRRYCSQECFRNSGHGRSREVPCGYCGKLKRHSATQLKIHKNHYCSNECRRRGQIEVQFKLCKVCPKCGIEKSRIDFYTTHKDGRGAQRLCKSCSSVTNIAYNKKWRNSIRLEVLRHYGQGALRCRCCAEDTLQFLALDHINGGGCLERRQAKRRGGTAYYYWLKANGYPATMQILCHNCNMAKAFWGICPHKEEVNKHELQEMA